MPMVDIQRRFQQVFRIRLGHTVETSNGKTRPEKLTNQIRVTAANKSVVEAFALVYGGEVQVWEDQWEVYLPTTELPIYILPGQAIEQWWERWRGSVCDRRCDGETMVTQGGEKVRKACICPADIDERLASKDACSPMTRLNVICPEVDVLGSGALVTHSMIAAETLPQSIGAAETALSRGLMVPAVLRIAEYKGRNHFIVPQVEVVGLSLNSLMSGDGMDALPHATRSPQRALLQSVPGRPALLQAVPESVPERPVASIREQALAAAEAKKPRANAAQPIPATGLEPRTADEAALVVPDDDEEEPTKALSAEEETWVDLFELLQTEEPTAGETKPVIEGKLRKLYELMGKADIWPLKDGQADPLHQALKKHAKADHVADLNKDPLLAFCQVSWVAARDAVAKAE